MVKQVTKVQKKDCHNWMDNKLLIEFNLKNDSLHMIQNSMKFPEDSSSSVETISIHKNSILAVFRNIILQEFKAQIL